MAFDLSQQRQEYPQWMQSGIGTLHAHFPDISMAHEIVAITSLDDGQVWYCQVDCRGFEIVLPASNYELALTSNPTDKRRITVIEQNLDDAGKPVVAGRTDFYWK